jgi:hypothetical protein
MSGSRLSAEGALPGSSPAAAVQAALPAAAQAIEGSQPLMNLRVLRGPLESRQNAAILHHYNNLSSSKIPISEFLHWVQDGPDGPAWHAILESELGEIVGHCAVIPMRGRFSEETLVAGKAEYAFILAEYQTAKIQGLESLGKPRNAILIRELFQRCTEEGIGPLFISTSAARRRSLSSLGLTATVFPVSEFLFVLRPLRAARKTPNLQRWQRMSVGLAGILQRGGWPLIRLLWQLRSKGRPGSTIEYCRLPEATGLSFFEDRASARWRFLPNQYPRIGHSPDGEQYAVAKTGSGDRYLRVCHWRVEEGQSSESLVNELIERAISERALGVRWAIYGWGETFRELGQSLRRLGFLCARRERTILVYSKDPAFLVPTNWKLNDAMFSFDP